MRSFTEEMAKEIVDGFKEMEDNESELFKNFERSQQVVAQFVEATKDMDDSDWFATISTTFDKCCEARGLNNVEQYFKMAQITAIAHAIIDYDDEEDGEQDAQDEE